METGWAISPMMFMGVITSILYLALGMVSTMVLNLIASSGVVVSVILLAVCAGLLFWWKKKKKLVKLIFGILSGLLGLFGLLQATGILSGVPVLALGIPAVLSCYFDFFSGFVQAYVFSLLTMAYIAGACPPPAEKAQDGQ